MFSRGRCVCFDRIILLREAIRNLPVQAEEKTVCRNSQTCAETKPCFYCQPRPVSRPNPYILTILNQFIRNPFIFPYSDIHFSSKTVDECLPVLFSLFGFLEYLHSDRRMCFVDKETKVF